MGEAMTLDEIRCNICHSRTNEKKKKGVFGNPKQDIYKCGDCGHIFLGPLMDDADEEKFYINEYPAFLLKRGDLKSTTPEEHFIKNKAEAVRRFELIKAFLSPKKNVLELGSASGFFLDQISPYAKDVCGIEPNSAHLEYACKKGITTYKTLKNLGDNKFDIIFLYYVLEHVKDPGGFVRNMKTLLKNSDSKIILEVPNVKEALVSLYHSPAYNEFVWQRAHCSYFSTDVLDKLFKRYELDTEFIPVQRYDFSNHIHWLTAGKPGGVGKYSHIFSESFNNAYTECLKKAWSCDTILAIASPA